MLKEIGLSALVMIPIGIFLAIVMDDPFTDWRYWALAVVVGFTWSFRSDIKELFR